MKETLGCRWLVRAAGGGPGPFALPGSRPQRAPDRPVQVTHLRIELTPDLDAGTIDAATTLTVRAHGAPREGMTLDAVELDVREVRAGDGEGTALAFTNDGARLRVTFATPLAPGAEATFTVRYGARPRRGLYFVRPDAHYPDKPRQLWSQCQDEDARHWFPCPDSPNHRCTTEMVCTVPAGHFCLSNGELVERRPGPRAGTEIFHWKQQMPHPPYLVTVVVGDFDEHHEDWEGVRLDYYYPKGRAEEARRTFENTPKILAFFSEYTGVKYPYSKYAQVIVADFIFGGMENTSATTLSDRTLHDTKAHVDFDSDGLVAHEAAHQWFGDLVTCRSWSHAWLNEGFATYFDALFHEHHRGRDELAFYMDEMAEEYFEEVRGSYRRPIVCETYLEPIELFDRHLYQKGGLVLHMLRETLGDDAFRAALKHYLERNRAGNVETVDLARAIEDTTGRNLDGFFDQWVRRGGHPELEVSYAWSAEGKDAALTVKQTQEVTPEQPVFQLTLPLRFVLPGGATVQEKVEVTQAQHVFHFTLSAEPLDVVVDAGNVLLKRLVVEKASAMHRHTLATAPEAIARAMAARALGRKHEPGVVAALGRALVEDAFWGVQAAAARSLGVLREAEARDVLLGALEKVTHAKARRAVVEALGNYRRDEAAGAALLRVAEKGDVSWFVEYEALRALGRGRYEGAFEKLVALKDRPSWGDWLQKGALDGLAALRDERGIEPALQDAQYGRPKWARPVAVRAAGKLADGKRGVAEEVAELLDDADLPVRIAAVDALEDIGHEVAVARLEAYVERELDGRGRRGAREALRGLRSGAARDGKMGALREQVERVQEEARELRDRLAALEKRLERGR
ncbi:MAG TPA: M1 family aminopeptidase [Myxococcota bacterium]|nr:M1 family aminopeptidase [Myxococcota bacterium]